MALLSAWPGLASAPGQRWGRVCMCAMHAVGPQPGGRDVSVCVCV